MVCATFVFAQRKKDGSPDMRYKANKQVYSAPSYNYSNTNTQTTYQKGYVKQNGIYVDSHYKTKKNNTNHDNYSTYSNTNPYTNQQGSRAKDYSNQAQNYGKGKTIQQGTQGGQYYINNSNKKTYVPKRN